MIAHHRSALVPSIGVLFLLTGCTRPSFTTPKTIVDLSPSIGEDLPLLSLGKRVFQESGGRDTTTFQHSIVETPFYAARSYIELDNHTGPHHDPPNHLIKGAKSTDQISLGRFYGHAIVIDFRTKPKDQPLMATDFQNRGIQPDDIVIAFVGYRSPTTADELPSYAYLSGEAAEYLATLPVKAFATDMPSLGGIKHYTELSVRGVQGSQAFFPEHYAFLSREIPAIECLVNLEAIVNEKNVVFVGFPIKIKDGSGAPMRPAALIY